MSKFGSKTTIAPTVNDANWEALKESLSTGCKFVLDRVQFNRKDRGICFEVYVYSVEHRELHQEHFLVTNDVRRKVLRLIGEKGL